MEVLILLLLLLVAGFVLPYFVDYQKDWQIGITWKVYIMTFSIVVILLNTVFQIPVFKRNESFLYLLNIFALLCLAVIFWKNFSYNPYRMVLIFICSGISIFIVPFLVKR